MVLAYHRHGAVIEWIFCALRRDRFVLVLPACWVSIALECAHSVGVCIMSEDSPAGAQRRHSCRSSGQFTLLDRSPHRMNTSQPPAHQQRCPEPEKLQDRVCDGGAPKTVTRKMTERFVGAGRRLSTISEREPDRTDADPGSRDPLGGSSASICSSKLNDSSSCLSSDESYQPDGGDDCATLLLACLHCRFHELMDLLPVTCERAVQRCFPSYKYIMESGDAREQQGRDWCSYKLELDCNCCGSCQDAGELIELAMEISEVCYR